jgi:acyl-homoserine-lactone acylase
MAVALVAGLSATACGRADLAFDPARLAGDVTIRRDTFGIPHILASSEESAAYAFGYAQAEDHALEIVRRMISARGEEAKYFGGSGIDNDAGMAQFDNIGEARRGLSALSPLFHRIVSSYAGGVNAYLIEHRSELPDWVHPISAADVIANSRAGAVNALSGSALVTQLRNKYEKSGPAGADAGPPAAAEASIDGVFDEAPGSNAFALAGSRTSTGKPILLGNPHLSWSSLYWEAHVRVPGRIDFYGSTLVGIPVLRAGFNDRLGFVTTNNAPDLDDVYAIALDRDRADHYRFEGRSVPLTRRDVSIAVRTSDGSERQEHRTFWSTEVGPVIYRTADKVFSVKSSRLEAFRYFEGFYRLSKARTLDQWLAALRLNLVPTSNFTYADVDGNILYQWNGNVPVRAAGGDYTLDVPAAARRDVWSRIHALDDLPRLLNPPGGYIQNANNPPGFVSARDPIDMSGFPSYFERGPLALRPQLAIEMLDSGAKFSVEDVIRAKYDTRMLLASRVRQPLIDAVRATPDAPAVARDGAAVLEAWDGRVAAASRGAVLFQRFWDTYSRRVRQPFAAPWDAADPIRTPAGLADPVAAIEELASAVRSVRQLHGSESVAWGDVNRFRIGSVDLPGDGATGTYGCFRVLRFDPVPGGSGPIRVAGNLEPGGGLTGFGDAWVLLVDFSVPVTGWSVLAYGQTARLASPHSRDQISIFARHGLRRAWYTESDITTNLERSYRPPLNGASPNSR